MTSGAESNPTNHVAVSSLKRIPLQLPIMAFVGNCNNTERLAMPETTRAATAPVIVTSPLARGLFLVRTTSRSKFRSHMSLIICDGQRMVQFKWSTYATSTSRQYCASQEQGQSVQISWDLFRVAETRSHSECDAPCAGPI